MINIMLLGDILITRPVPAHGYVGCKELTDLKSRHDVKFANLEFRKGKANLLRTFPLERDVARVITSIRGRETV